MILAVPEKPLPQRVLVVFDGVAWFTRRVKVIVHDSELDEMVYRCDKHLGGPFIDAQTAIDTLKEQQS